MDISIVVGSVLGASEYVADAVEELLTSRGHNIEKHYQPNINEVDLNKLLMVVTSTHGAGDLPDNIQEFADDLARENLQHLKAVIIGLGDSSYDTFCQGSATMSEIIEEAGGQLIIPVLQIDVLNHPIPEDFAVEWLTTNIEKLGL